MFDAEYVVIVRFFQCCQVCSPVDVSPAWYSVSPPAAVQNTYLPELELQDLRILSMGVIYPVPESMDGLEVVNLLPEKM